MLKVLLSDDNTKVFEPWKDRAIKQGISLECRENWEDAKIELETHWDDYHFVILDGMGKMTEDSSKTERRHVIVPVNWLKEMKGKGKYLPVVIYTAYLKDLEDIVQTDDLVLKIFDKGLNPIDMVLEYINKIISSTQVSKLRNKYPELLSSIENCALQPERKDDLIDLLTECESNFPNNIIDTFRKIRPILESMISRLYQLDSTILPAQYFNNGKPEISKSIKYLEGNSKYDSSTKKVTYSSPQYMPENIYYAATFVQKIVSSIGMHHSSEAVSKYSVLSCTYALIDVFNWFNDFVNTKYKQ